MFSSFKFATFVLFVSLSSTCSIISASEFNPEFPSLPSKRRTPEGGFNEEGPDNKKMRTALRNQTQERKVYFCFPLEVLSRVLEFSDLQSFYRFKLVSKEMKKETEREEYQIPEGEKVITWISSFRDKDTHLFDFDLFFSDFLKRNSHTGDSHKRLFNAANLYERQNSLFHFKGLFYGHESNTEASLSRVCANLLKEIEFLEKDLKPQSFAALQEKHQKLTNMLLVWQPYAIAHDLALRLFTQYTNNMWNDIEQIAQASSPLKQFLINPYLAGLFGSEPGLEELLKPQQTLLIMRDQLANQEIVKAYQLRDSTRLEYITTLYRYFEFYNLEKNVQNEIDQRAIRQELNTFPHSQLESFSKLNKMFDSLPPLLVSEEALNLFNTLESWLDNLQKKLAFKPQGTAQNRIKDLNQLLAYADSNVKIIENYLNIRDEVYPFATFYRVLARLDKIKEELTYTYTKAAQEAHALAELCTQKKEACTLYEKEAYYLKQQAYYLNLPNQAEAFLKSAQTYAKAGRILNEIDAQKTKELAQHASQMTLESLKYLMKISETDNCPNIYMILKEAASLVISSDKAKAAKFCEETAGFIKRGDRYIDCVEAALSYIIAGELIRETDPTKASTLFQKADEQQLTLIKNIKYEDTGEVGLEPEEAEEISDAYKEAALCLESYDKEKAVTFYAKAEEFKKYAEDHDDESS